MPRPRPHPRQGAYDETLRACFGVQEAPAFSTRTLGGGEISATRIRCDITDNGLSNPLPREDAWLLTVQLTDCPSHELWIDGKPRLTAPLAAGAASIYDLRTDPRVNSVSPFMNTHFHLPMATLSAIAERDGFASIDGYPVEPGIGFEDGVIFGLCQSLQPAFDRPQEANRLFVDHVTQALAGYLAQRFGNRKRAPPPHPVRLSRAQLRRTRDLLAEELTGDLTTADLVDGLGITPAELSAGFLEAEGEAPHRWQLRRRVDKALDLIRTTGLGMEEIALQCGFADAPHMHRALGQIYGRTRGVSR